MVAMSGAFSGTCVPVGIVADAFFAKGSDPALLLKAVVAKTELEQLHSREQSIACPRGLHPLALNACCSLRQYPYDPA